MENWHNYYTQTSETEPTHTDTNANTQKRDIFYLNAKAHRKCDGMPFYETKADTL